MGGSDRFSGGRFFCKGQSVPDTYKLLRQQRAGLHQRIRKELSGATMYGLPPTDRVEEIYHAIRRYFGEEETSMIRTGYSDYEFQHFSHVRLLHSFRTELGRESCFCTCPGGFRHWLRFIDHWLGQHGVMNDRHFLEFLKLWEDAHKSIPHKDDLLAIHPEYLLLNTKMEMTFASHFPLDLPD